MRVLIISPHFPPSNAADMQRVRHVLPYLREHGIDAEVLCVESNQVAAPQDAWLAAGLPTDVRVHRVKALDLGWGRLPGLGTLTFRALGALRRRGDAVLGGGGQEAGDRGQGTGNRGQETGDSGLRMAFDLVYFSTTQFGVHVLGPRWKKKFGVPFVMDYQDPWVSDYYREHPEVVPPGGRLKYAVASWLNRRQEPKVLRECSGITSVSAAYPEQLAKRYPWLKVEEQEPGSGGQKSEDGRQGMEGRSSSSISGISIPINNQQSTINNFHPLPSLVLPFPGDVRDFERVKSGGIQQSVFNPQDGLRHWVLVGRGGADMALAVRALFSALQTTLNSQPSTLNSFRLHFIGTSYAAAGTGVKTIEPLAREYGLEQQVIEHPDRIPYSETLRCLLDANVLIIPGSDDPGYTASKIYPYLLAGKPLLAIFHEQSSVVELIRKAGGGTVVAFATGEAPDAIAARIARTWLDSGCSGQVVSLNGTAFAPYTARAQAANLVKLWQHCLIA